MVNNTVKLNENNTNGSWYSDHENSLFGDSNDWRCSVRHFMSCQEPLEASKLKGLLNLLRDLLKVFHDRLNSLISETFDGIPKTEITRN